MEQQQIIIMSEQTQLKQIKLRLTVLKFYFTALKVSPFSSIVGTPCVIAELNMKQISEQRMSE